VDADPELLELLRSIGLRATDDAARAMAAAIDRGAEAGLDPAALPHVLQAYVRAVSRIVAVEASIALDALRQTQPDSVPRWPRG